MTRTLDVAPPAVTPHPVPPGAPIESWRYRPVFALEMLPQAAYTWDDADPAVLWDADVTTHGYLTPTVGTVTTPNPGPLPSQWVIVAHVRPTDLTGSPNNIAAYWRPGQWAWSWEIQGAMQWWQSTTGSNAAPTGLLPQSEVLKILANNADGWVGVAVSGSTLTPLKSQDGVAWQPAAAGVVGLPPINSTAVVDIGCRDGNPALAFHGRIYSIELRTGLNPAAGTVLWRFDADDYPGTGTTYTDPRGRTWTLTNAAAITPAVRNPTPPYVWDAPLTNPGYLDAVCDFIAADIAPGDADELFLYPPVELTLTLNNPNGQYTPWSADGRLTYWAPGRRVAVFVIDQQTGAKWWLFSGRVSSWQLAADDTVTVTAFDGLAWLAQEVGGDWTPGAAGQTPAQRITACAAAIGYPDPLRLAVGNVTLSTAPTDHPPLEEIQRVALSDGGVFYGDADGTLLYRDRLWRAGRDDQTVLWAVSDNVCTAPVVVWDAEMAADDDRLVTNVRLVNAAGLVATAAATTSVWVGDARYVLAHPDPDLWTTQADGNALASYLVGQQSQPSMALRAFDLYPLAPGAAAVADMAVQVRRGDRVEVLHEFTDPNGNPAMLDLYAVVLTVGHSITPETWVSSLSLSRTVDYRTPELWDRTLFTWDQSHPANVWRF